MQRLLTEFEKAQIIEREWAKARAKNPNVVMRVDVQDETDESEKPKVSVVIALAARAAVPRIQKTEVDHGDLLANPFRRGWRGHTHAFPQSGFREGDR